MKRKTLWFLFIPSLLILTGCVTLPNTAFQVTESALQARQLQMRQYETTDDQQILMASAGVLQDMGFTIDESERKLGVLVGSKDRDATSGGQVAAAFILTLLGGQGAFESIDHVQKIRAAVVTQPSLSGEQVVVRVTFQRVVWNKAGNVSRMETLKDPELYQGFFEQLSKAIFLEEHKI